MVTFATSGYYYYYWLLKGVCLWSSRVLEQLTKGARGAGGGAGLARGRRCGFALTRYVPGRQNTGRFQRVVVHPFVGRLLAAAVVLDQASPAHARADTAHTWREDRRVLKIFLANVIANTCKKLPSTGFQTFQIIRAGIPQLSKASLTLTRASLHKLPTSLTEDKFCQQPRSSVNNIENVETGSQWQICL